MKIEKLRIGKTYYMPVKHNPTNYRSGVLIEINSKSDVVLEDDNGKRIHCSAYKLHKRADKAVKGRKAQERVRHQMNKTRQKKKKILIKNSRIFLSRTR